MVLTNTLFTEIQTAVITELTNEFTHLAVGTDNTTPTASDTTLGAEVFRDATFSTDTSTPGTFIATLEVLTTEANSNALVEVGVFDAASSGNLWMHETFNTINKTSDIQLFFDAQVDVTVTETS